MSLVGRSPFGHRRRCGRGRRHYDGRRDGRGGRRGGRRGGVQQGLSRRLRRRCRRCRRCVLMRGIRLFQGGLQVTDVLDHPLDHLELRQLPFARHVWYEGAQLRQVSGHLLGLEIAPGAADSQAVVQDTVMIGRDSASQWANHHRLHYWQRRFQVMATESINLAFAFSFREHAAWSYDVSARARTHIQHARTHTRMYLSICR